MSKAWEFNCPKYYDFELGDEGNAPPTEEYFESHKDSPNSPLRRRQALQTVNTTHLKSVKSTTTFENGHRKVPAPTTKCVEKAECKSKRSKPATSVHNVCNRTVPSKAKPTMAEFIHNYFFKTPARLRSKMTATTKPRHPMKTTVPISPKLRTMLRAKQRAAAKKTQV
ncbi:uncharacterized protein LOC119466502 [Dermacentor silvarum]|uniref:uncharacterized protein LOC119466502 n=1 Tax=Dermacentor silvarum TaxID=543639 RepID=UPI0018996429|nr:uncharacterized protein LOC119466502 [Dermacentor silvarum]